MLMTVLAFLVTIGVLVIIHEYGHYRAAVACDVKVLRFSVGFGRVLWSRERGDTEFVVSALPLGGYVKMLDEREGPVPPAELHRAFNRKSLWQRAFVVSAGPLANLALAVLLFAAANWAGVEELKARLSEPVAASLVANAGMISGDEIVAMAPSEPGSNASAPVDASAWQSVRSMSDLQWQLTQAVLKGEDLRMQVRRAAPGREPSTETLLLHTSKLPASDVDARLMDRLGFSGPYAAPEVGRVFPGGPGEAAGLKTGDRVLRLDGRTPQDAAQLRGWIAAGDTTAAQLRPLSMEVLRQGQSVTLSLTPVVKDESGKRVARIMVEIGSPVEWVEVHYGPIEGLTRAVAHTWDVSALSLSMLGKMVVGQASLKNLSGPLTIADYAGKSAELGLTHYLNFLALVSVSLGVLNLLPLPILDGGHLMYYLFEGLTGRPVSDAWLERLQRGGVAVMFLMMSLALYNDFARLLGMH
jgi:regulator of sigma E protease